MPWPNSASLETHGWRSVSFVDNRHARVLDTKENAPAFLRKAMGRTYIWDLEMMESMFPQELSLEEKCEVKTAR